MTPRLKRFKLLLDEMLPRKIKYPQLNNFHDVKHIVHDCHQSGISDTQILKLARRDNRILVTKNIKHFQSHCQEYKVDVMGVTETILPEQLDKSIVAILHRWGKSKMTGRFTKIVKAPRKS